jgi:hypothetical protein
MFLLEIFNHFAEETKLQDEFLNEFEDYINLNVLGKLWASLGPDKLETEHYPEFKQRKDNC